MLFFRPAHAQDRGPQSSDKTASGKPRRTKESAAPVQGRRRQLADAAGDRRQGRQRHRRQRDRRRKRRPPVKEADTAIDPSRHQVAQPAHVGLLCHLVRFDHCRLVCRGALPGTAAEQDPARRSGRRPAGLGQPQGRVRSPPCPAALQAISVLDGGGGAGHAGQGGASASRDRAGHDRGLRARGHAALHQRPRAEPGVQRRPDAGAGRHRARHDPLLLHHGPHAGGREQDGRAGDRHLRGLDLHAGRPDRGHSGRHSGPLFRRPDPQDVPAGRGPGPLARAAPRAFRGASAPARLGRQAVARHATIIEMPRDDDDDLDDEDSLPLPAEEVEGRP